MQVCYLLVRTLASSVRDVVDATNKLTRTAETRGEKGQHGRSLSERTRPDPCLDRLLLLSGSITSKKVLIRYAQVCFR